MGQPDAIKLLVIDAKAENLSALVATVQAAYPHGRVLMAADSAAGLALAVAEDPDVILLDITTPSSNGVEVCRRLKADARLEDIPVLLLTGLATGATARLQALEAGADAFLAMPVDRSEVTAQIRTLTKLKTANRSQRQEATRLEAMVAERTQRLYDSEFRYRSLFQNMASGWCVHELVYADGRTVDYRILDINPAYERITGIRREEAVGALASTLYGLGQAPFLDLYCRVAETGEPADFDAWFEPLQKHLHVSAGSPKAGFFSTVFTDITQRKHAEEALRYHLALVTSLLDSIPDLIFFKTKEGVYLGCNREFARHVGRTPEEIVGKTDRDLYDEASASAFSTNDRLMLDQESPRRNEEWVDYHDGRRILLDTLKAPLVTPSGEIIGLLGVSRDITERKQAEVYAKLGREILEILSQPAELEALLSEIVIAIKDAIAFDAVGIRLQQGDDYPYVAQEGFSDAFLEQENSLVQRRMDGGLCRDDNGKVLLECTCGLIISGETDPSNPIFTPGGSAWTNDAFPLLNLPPDLDPRAHPRNTCIHQGYASIALAPIRAKGVAIGLIQINDRQPGRLSLAMVEMLEQLGERIGEALLRKQAEETLKASQELLAETERVGKVGGWSFNIDTLAQTWTDEVYRIHELEISPNPSVKRGLEYYTEASRPLIEEAVHRAMVCGDDFDLELEIITAKGNRRAVKTIGRADLQKRRIYGFFQDITERKRAEEALRTSEAAVRKKLQSIVDPEGDIGALALSDIIDTHIMQSMMEAHYQATGMLGAVLDLSGKVLVACGWQDICTKFHRCHPDTLSNCLESDTLLTQGVAPGTFKAYRCKNLMWDVVTPLMLGERHVGNVFLGQFFYDDEVPDRERFRAQAQRHGFDEEAYLAALDRVPRFSREAVEAGISFYAKLAKVVATLSYNALTQARMLAQHRQAEEALRKSETLFRKVFETLPVGLWIADQHGKLKRGNPAGIAIWGAEPNVAQEQYGVFTARRLPSGEAIAPHDWALAHTVNRGVTIVDELLEIDAFDGQKRIILNHTAPVLDDQGQIFAAIVVNQDITDQFRATQALERERTQFFKLLESLPGFICLQAPDYSVRYANQHFIEIFGDHRGRPCYQFMLGRDQACTPCPAFEVFQSKQPQTREWSHALTGRTYLIHKFPFVDTDDTLLVLKYGVDITERKEAEAQRAKLEERLRISQKMEAVGSLAGGVAHDFNNLLSVILSYTRFAMEGLSDGDPIKDDLQEVKEAGERAATLTRQLLAFSRKQILQPKILNLNQVIAGIEKMLRRLIGEDIEIVQVLAPDLGTVHADAGQI